MAISKEKLKQMEEETILDDDERDPLDNAMTLDEYEEVYESDDDEEEKISEDEDDKAFNKRWYRE